MARRNLVRACGVALALVTATAGSAQQGAPDRTGTGGGPNSTITAPNTTATGTTKPPGVEEGPATPAERRELDRIREQNDRIDKSVCDGCN